MTWPDPPGGEISPAIITLVSRITLGGCAIIFLIQLRVFLLKYLSPNAAIARLNFTKQRFVRVCLFRIVKKRSCQGFHHPFFVLCSCRERGHTTTNSLLLTTTTTLLYPFLSGLTTLSLLSLREFNEKGKKVRKNLMLILLGVVLGFTLVIVIIMGNPMLIGLLTLAVILNVFAAVA